MKTPEYLSPPSDRMDPHAVVDAMKPPRKTIDDITREDADPRSITDKARDDAAANAARELAGARLNLEHITATNFTGARETALRVARQRLADAERAAGVAQ